MANKPSKTASSSESATMASLRRTAEAPPEQGGTAQDIHGVDVVPVDLRDEEVIEATVIQAERAARWIVEKGYKPATQEIVSYVAGRAIDTSDLNVVILEQMALRFANATTAMDILDPFGTIKGQNILGRPIEVLGVEFLESDVAEGFPWYVSFQVMDRDSGRTRVVTVGGEKLVLQAAALDKGDMWPLVVVIAQSERETKAGFRPLELRPAG